MGCDTWQIPAADDDPPAGGDRPDAGGVIPTGSEPLPGCLVLLPGALVLVVALGAIAAAGRAQDAAAGPEDGAVIALARTCVSERGWRVGSDDCAAIGAVARRTARVRGVTLGAALRALSPRLHGDGCLVSRAWLCRLELDGRRPAGLGAPWERPRAGGLPSRRDAWLATVEAARAIVAGEAPSPCSAEPHAWGSDADVRRRRAAGWTWTDVDCGETANRFGALGRRGP